MLSLKAKLIIGAALVAATGFALFQAYDAGFEAGQAIKASEIQTATDKAVTAATKQVRADMQAALDRKERERLNALRIAEELEQQRDEVKPNEIIRTVEVNNCKRLGTDVMELYNRINGSGRPSSRSGGDG
jgi:L-rhamnose isomerase